MPRQDDLNRIMRGLASTFPTDGMRLALRALIGTDERPESVDYRFMGRSAFKTFAPDLTLEHVHLIKGALVDAPEPWRQIVQAVVSYVELRDTIQLYERERELQACNQ